MRGLIEKFVYIPITQLAYGVTYQQSVLTAYKNETLVGTISGIVTGRLAAGLRTVY